MIDQQNRTKSIMRGLGTLATLMLLATGWSGVATSLAEARQGQTANVAIVTTDSGQPVSDACFVLAGYSQEGCDENGDGQITFQDVPLGTYTLHQTANLGPVRYVPDTTITVTGAMDADGWERFYVAIETSASTSIGQTRQVAIFTDEAGQSAYDACYILVDYSNEGCDENQDGRVMFDDIPWGTYTVHQTADLGPGRHVDDFTIEVRGNISSAGWEGFSATIVNSTGGSVVQLQQNGEVDIALITRDPQDGHLLTGTCYVLVDYSNEGCDENGDGQVTFAAIPYGTYTVRQTQTPAGYPTINDYAINVEPVQGMPGGPFGVPLGFIVKQAPQQNAPDTRNVSVVLIDMTTHEKIPAGGCVELVGASNIGCDEDLIDGQIDFLDVPAGGPYELRFTNLPAGYEVVTVGGPLAIFVDSEPGAPANQVIFAMLATQNSDASVEGPESAQVVGEDGFRLTLDGVWVSGAPGVAPIGTTVRAKLVEHDLPEGISGFAEPVGPGLEVTLGEGIQPASPLIITFAPDVVSSWDSAPDATDHLVPVVFTSKVEGPGMELADAHLLPDGSVEVTADHLSPFQPALASISGFADWLDEQVLIFAQVRSERPDCVDQRAEDLGWEFSAVPNQLFWPCADETTGGLEVTFTNNSPEVWLVESDQATPELPSTLSITGATIAAVARQGIDQTTTTPLVPPDGVVTFQVHDQEGPVVFDASLNKTLTITNAFVSGVSVILPSKKLEALGRAECFLDVVSTGLTASEKLEDAAYGGLSGTIIRCVGDAVGGLGGTLISAVGAIPGAGTAALDTVVRGLTGRDEFSITLSKLEDVPDELDRSASSSSAWPTDRNDTAQGLYTWIGASSVWSGTGISGMPDWVACDDARNYCLLGYNRGDHVLVRIDGFEIVGTVANWYPDPIEALLILGIPEEAADQILGI